MKKLTALLLCLTFLFGLTSCVVYTAKDNGLHRGWYKPHHPSNHGQSKKH